LIIGNSLKTKNYKFVNSPVYIEILFCFAYVYIRNNITKKG